MSSKYTIRRTTNVDYQLENPDGTVLVSAEANNVPSLPSDPNEQPNVPADLAEPVVSYAENNDLLHEWRVIQWVGLRYIDDR